MKLSRFRLRTLLIVIALLSVPMGWVAYQLNWIRQRHEFLAENPTFPSFDDSMEGQSFARFDPPAPWQLRIFGEPGHDWVGAPKHLTDRARKLFPEARIPNQQ